MDMPHMRPFHGAPAVGSVEERGRSLMRYAFYARSGAATEVLGLANGPVPAPGVDEVLVRVMASGVNPSDVKTRAAGRPIDAPPFIVPHSDGAGVIEAVGAGIDPARVGERVWLWNGQWGRQWGTAADHIALPARQAVRLPDAVSFEVGATLGVPWLTAWRAVHYHPIRARGDTLLVQGGAGAVGFYAIQLAKRAGFRVIATVSSAEKAQVARDAGANLVVDYKREDLAAAVTAATDGAGVDRIVEVDLTGNASTYTKVLRPGGFVAAYGSRGWVEAALPLRDWLFHGIELAIFIVYELPTDVRARAIEDSFDALVDPGFRSMIAARFPLDQIATAHELVESGSAIGNVLVAPGHPHRNEGAMLAGAGLPDDASRAEPSGDGRP